MTMGAFRDLMHETLCNIVPDRSWERNTTSMNVEDEVDALLGEFNAGDGAELGTTVILGHDKHGRAIRVGSLLSVGDEEAPDDKPGFLLGWAARIENSDEQDGPGYLEVVRFDGKEGGGQNGEWIVVDPFVAETEVIDVGDLVSLSFDDGEQFHPAIVAHVPVQGKHDPTALDVVVIERGEDKDGLRVRPFQMGRTERTYTLAPLWPDTIAWKPHQFDAVDGTVMNSLRRLLPRLVV